MQEEMKPKMIRRQFDTYFAMIENSVGSYMFKNLYAEIDGVKKDITEDGWLSCAFFASSVLYLCGYVDGVHATVVSTVKDLKRNGWIEITEPVPGSVLVWRPNQGENKHSHIGFYVGDNMAISNDSGKKHPWKGDWKFNGKRDIDLILWNPEILKVST